MSTAEYSRTKSVPVAMFRLASDRRTCPRCGRKHAPKLRAAHPHRNYCRDCRETEPSLVNGWDPEQVTSDAALMVRWMHGYPTLAIRDRHF